MVEIKKRNKRQKRIAIYHGPMNIGGIGGYLAKSQREKGFISDFVVWSDFTNRKNNDFNLHIENFSLIKKIFVIFGWFFLALLKYDIFHFYFGHSLLPFNFDLPILKLFRKKIVMTYCGSDIRLIKVEKKRNPYWKIVAKVEGPDWKKILKMKWQNLWIDKFTAARNLYDYARLYISEKKLYQYPWINQVFDFPKELEGYAPTNNKVPLVVHAPTHFDIKGTKEIERTIEELKREGYKFEYKRLYKVPNAEAQKILKKADIIIDQIYLGGIGNLGFEAMLMGKPVMVYVIPEVMERYFPGAPIVNTNKENLKENLKWLLERPEEREKIGKKAYEWVKKHLDREKIFNWVIEELYGLKGVKSGRTS